LGQANANDVGAFQSSQTLILGVIAMKVVFSVPVILLGVSVLGGAATAAAQAQGETKPAAPAAASTPAPAEAVPSAPAVVTEPADRSRIVYVSDFEVDLASKDGKSTPVTASPSTASGSGPSETRKEETPAERAGHFVDFVSTTLIKELEKEGYLAQRLQPGESRPDEGIRISGVFAEPDEENRLRRAVIGSGPSVGQMALFVSIGNLARPDQPLYAVVDPKTAGNNVGPVISVSAYAPVARFELPKNVTEKAVRDTATSIVTDLTQLLRTNVASLTR
jgi:hypothetical protein